MFAHSLNKLLVSEATGLMFTFDEVQRIVSNELAAQLHEVSVQLIS